MTAPQHSCPLTAQAVGWALHALEPDEEMAVQQHVPDCPDCAAAAREAAAALAQLGVSVEQVEPPASLRDAIMTSAARSPRRPQPPPQAAARRRHATPPAAPTTRPPARGRRLSRRRLAAVAAAAVALVTIGGLSVRTVQLQQQRDSVSAQAQSVTDLVRQMDRPGVSHALLARPDGTAVAAVVLAGGQREVYTLGLPANAADHTYVLWGLRSGVPQALGAFDVTSSGQGQHALGSPGGNPFEAYAISLEPGHSPPAAPTDVVAKGPLVA